jgi:hypothetical protein
MGRGSAGCTSWNSHEREERRSLTTESTEGTERMTGISHGCTRIYTEGILSFSVLRVSVNLYVVSKAYFTGILRFAASAQA